jgi:hypothetical protein
MRRHPVIGSGVALLSSSPETLTVSMCWRICPSDSGASRLMPPLGGPSVGVGKVMAGKIPYLATGAWKDGRGIERRSSANINVQLRFCSRDHPALLYCQAAKGYSNPETLIAGMTILGAQDRAWIGCDNQWRFVAESMYIPGRQ